MKNDASIPTVSVIVAIYNHFNWLRMILDALRLQTYKDFEWSSQMTARMS